MLATEMVLLEYEFVSVAKFGEDVSEKGEESSHITHEERQ